MKTYTDQHTPWRPDYPPVLNIIAYGRAIDVKEVSPRVKRVNLIAFTTARNAIDKAMKQ